MGKPPRIVAIRGHGEIAGEMAAIRHKPRSGSVIALDEVEATCPQRSGCGSSTSTRAMRTQLVTMDERLDQAMLKIVESYLAIAQGVAKALVELVDSGVGTRGQDGVVLCFSQQDLATLTGTSLDSVKDHPDLKGREADRNRTADIGHP
jgi:CRP/FNR family transcriptional regulator, cyclic AMP receptor protein